MSSNAFPRLKIAVSDCLRGTNCRYNAGHAADDFINKELAKYADFYPFCPEAAVLGTPRETIRLVGTLENITVFAPKSGTDVTAGITDYTQRMVPKLLAQNLDGAVVKSGSPSCGLERIKVYNPSGQWHAFKDPMTAGVFTAQLKAMAPHLAVEEEGRLHDAWLRENFVIQAFTSARWREFLQGELTLVNFQAFHRDHKYLFMSKHVEIYREMGALVATTRQSNLRESVVGYQGKLFALLAYRSKRGNVKMVLDHIYGYFKGFLSSDEKAHYHESVHEFVNGIVPLIAIIKVLEQYLNAYGSDYLATQVFFKPYPADLGLRSKIAAYR